MKTSLGSISAVVMVCICAAGIAAEPQRKTTVSIVGDAFHINGKPTYEGRTWKGKKIEGLLFNSRMVQGIFDDLNPETRDRWAYPDTGKWDAERNTREFIAAMPEWRRHGLLCFTINLQGGSPQGYSRRPAVAQLGDRRRRLAAARLHGAAGEDPRPGRRAGDGRDPRRLLLRPGRAAEGRGGRQAGGRQRRRLGASTAATATC